MTATIQAYQFALDLAPEQEAMLRSHCGARACTQTGENANHN